MSMYKHDKEDPDYKSSKGPGEKMLNGTDIANNNVPPVSGSLLNYHPDKEQTKDSDDKELVKEKRNINKNVFIINIAFFLWFTSFVGLSIIQSSIIGNVGTMGLGVIFGGTLIACLVVSPVMIKLCGCKWTMVGSFFMCIIWMVSNFYPTWGTVMPAALIAGLANGPVWTAQATYFTIKGLRYAEVTGEAEEAVIARFFGLFFCFLLFGTTVGCAITSGILTLPIFEEAAESPPLEIGLLSINTSLGNQSASSAENLGPIEPPPRPMELCGSGYCPGNLEIVYSMMFPGLAPLNATNATNITAEPEMQEVSAGDLKKLYLLIGIHALLTVIAMLMVLFLVDRLPKAEPTEGEPETTLGGVKRSLTATVRQIKRKRQLLATPLNIYAGLSQSFILADITEAFVACPLSVEMIGFVLMTYGVAACLVSIFCGFIIKVVGRLPVFTIGGAIRLGTTLLLLLWVPDATKMYIFFMIPALWATGDGLYMSQINAFYGVMFHDNSEGAFSAYRFWEGVGLVSGYVYNSLLCVNHKIYILLVVHTVGWILYYVVELAHRRKVQKDMPPDQKYSSREVIDITDIVDRESSI